MSLGARKGEGQIIHWPCAPHRVGVSGIPRTTCSGFQVWTNPSGLVLAVLLCGTVTYWRGRHVGGYSFPIPCITHELLSQNAGSARWSAHRECNFILTRNVMQIIHTDATIHHRPRVRGSIMLGAKTRPANAPLTERSRTETTRRRCGCGSACQTHECITTATSDAATARDIHPQGQRGELVRLQAHSTRWRARN